MIIFYMSLLAKRLYLWKRWLHPLVRVIIAGFKVIGWLTGWPIIFIGIALDLIIAFAIISHNAKYFMYKQEDDEQ